MNDRLHKVSSIRMHITRKHYILYAQPNGIQPVETTTTTNVTSFCVCNPNYTHRIHKVRGRETRKVQTAEWKKRELIYNVERKQREDIERDVRFENVFISLRLFYLNSNAQHNGSKEIPCENVEKTHITTQIHMVIVCNEQDEKLLTRAKSFISLVHFVTLPLLLLMLQLSR